MSRHSGALYQRVLMYSVKGACAAPVMYQPTALFNNEQLHTRAALGWACLGVHAAAAAKVRQAQAVAGYQDVLRLDVPVEDASRVQVRQRLRQPRHRPNAL